MRIRPTFLSAVAFLATATASAQTPISNVQIGALAPAKPNNAIYATNPNGPVLHLKAGSGVSNAYSMIAFENPDGHVRSVFDTEGMYATNGWMTISGGFRATMDANGLITDITTGNSGVPTMLDVVADVANAVVIKGGNTVGSQLITGLDYNGLWRFSIGEDGKLSWGSGNGLAALDTNLYRNGAGALKTDGSLELGTQLIVPQGLNWPSSKIPIKAAGVNTGISFQGGYQSFITDNNILVAFIMADVSIASNGSIGISSSTTNAAIGADVKFSRAAPGYMKLTGSATNGALSLGNTTLALTGGALGLPRMAPSGIAPGPTGAKFEVVCGTSAGTVRLQMYGGTSPVPVTIADNVGAGASGC